MIFYLVRHGLSISNEAGLVTGTPNDPLSETGRLQAKQLAAWMKVLGITPHRYVVSQWLRARETASILFPGVAWNVDSRVGETNAGNVANKPLVEFLDCHPDFYADPSNSYPSGESHLGLNSRVMDWFTEQLQNPCASIMLAAHSGPISCLLQYILGVDMASFPAFLPAHASMSVVRLEQCEEKWLGRLMGFSLGPISNIQSVIHAK